MRVEGLPKPVHPCRVSFWCSEVTSILVREMLNSAPLSAFCQLWYLHNVALTVLHNLVPGEARQSSASKLRGSARAAQRWGSLALGVLQHQLPWRFSRQGWTRICQAALCTGNPVSESRGLALPVPWAPSNSLWFFMVQRKPKRSPKVLRAFEKDPDVTQQEQPASMLLLSAARQA